METEIRKMAVYSRKSKFTGRGESIENQIGLCRQYIKNFHGEDEETQALVYEDEGFSGGNLKRPQFRRMMADARQGKIKAVVVYRLDRISRNIGDFAGLIDELGGMGVSFVSIREQFDTSSPMGRAMMYIASVFSQLERETIAERIRDNMYELAKTGRWLGGNTPTGYRSEAVTSMTVEGKARKACMLAKIPEEADLVTGIYKKFLECHSLAGTEAWLLQSGRVTRSGKAFKTAAIKGILENPVYGAADCDTYRYFEAGGVCLCSKMEVFDGLHGVMAYNRTLQKPGRANKVRDMSEWVVAVGKHEPLLCGNDWCLVQRLINENRRKGCRRQKSGQSLLAGVLFCGNCEAFMRPKLASGTDERGERRFTYLCTEKEKSRAERCGMKNAAGNRLDQAVLQAVSGLLEDREELVRQLNRAIRALGQDSGSGRKRLCKIQEERKKTEDKIRELVEALSEAEDSPAKAYLFAGIEELHEKRRRLEDQEQEALKKTENSPSKADTEVAARRLSDFSTTLSLVCRERQREAIRELVSCVRWEGEKAQVYFIKDCNG